MKLRYRIKLWHLRRLKLRYEKEQQRKGVEANKSIILDYLAKGEGFSFARSERDEEFEIACKEMGVPYEMSNLISSIRYSISADVIKNGKKK